MLIGRNIQLRYLNQSDLNFLYKIENDQTLWRYGSEKKYFSKKVLSEYINNSKLDITINNQLRFVIDFKNTPIGLIDLYDYRKSSAGIGIVIIEEYREKGFGKESLLLIKKYCSGKLKIRELFCAIQDNNMNSVKLFTSIGFKEKNTFKNIKYYRIGL